MRIGSVTGTMRIMEGVADATVDGRKKNGTNGNAIREGPGGPGERRTVGRKMSPKGPADGMGTAKTDHPGGTKDIAKIAEGMRGHPGGRRAINLQR